MKILSSVLVYLGIPLCIGILGMIIHPTVVAGTFVAEWLFLDPLTAKFNLEQKVTLSDSRTADFTLGVLLGAGVSAVAWLAQKIR